MVYRPTVRYADIFKTYVDELFKATTLDRNQIIRAALFSSAFSRVFQQLITKHKKKDVPLPSLLWSLEHHELWLEQNPTTKGGKDVNDNVCQTEKNRSEKQTIRSKEEVQERGKTLHSESEKVWNQNERRREKEKAFKPRTQQGPTRKIHSSDQGGIVIRIG